MLIGFYLSFALVPGQLWMLCGKHPHCILACQAESIVQSWWDKLSHGLDGISLTHFQRWINPTFLCCLRAKQHKTLAAMWPSFRGPHLRSCWPLCMTRFSSMDTRLQGNSAESSLDQWGYICIPQCAICSCLSQPACAHFVFLFWSWLFLSLLRNRLVFLQDFLLYFKWAPVQSQCLTFRIFE